MSLEDERSERERSNSLNITDEHYMIVNDDTDDDEEGIGGLRPFYPVLRLLGLWQPRNANVLCRIYNNFICICVWIFLIICVIGISFFGKIQWINVINGISRTFILGAPYLLTRYYFKYGRFNQLLQNIRSSSISQQKYHKMRYIYNSMFLLNWMVGFTYFYYHFQPYFISMFHYIIFGVVLFYSLGWWSMFLGIYNYICSCNKLQVQSFIQSMKLLYGYSSGSDSSEQQCVSKNLESFTELRISLQQTEQDFSNIISFSVAYNVVDLIIYSIAYWNLAFIKYDIWQYVAGVIFDVISILLTLYPAAIVNQELHEAVITAGSFCSPDGNRDSPSEERSLFYHYLFLREQDLGMNILGVKITPKVTVSIFATLTSMGLAILYHGSFYLHSDYKLFSKL